MCVFTSAHACVCENVCVSLGTVSFVGRLATSKAASHVTAGDRDLAGLWDEWNVHICVFVFLCECVSLHTVNAYCEVMSELRHVQISLSPGQSFPIAALDQGAWVKPWTRSDGVWKNLSQNNYNLSKYQTHGCSFPLRSVLLALSSGQTSQAKAPFYVVTLRKKISV